MKIIKSFKEAKDIYVDGIKVKKLINSKNRYTWFELVNGDIKKVLTVDYDNEVLGTNYRLGNPVYLSSIEESFKEAKEYEFDTANLYFKGIDTDSNGNKVAKFSYPNGGTFSIQTNQNLPALHKLSKGDMMDKGMEKEVIQYIQKHGSKKQKEGLKTNKNYKESVIQEGNYFAPMEVSYNQWIEDLFTGTPAYFNLFTLNPLGRLDLEGGLKFNRLSDGVSVNSSGFTYELNVKKGVSKYIIDYKSQRILNFWLEFNSGQSVLFQIIK